MPTTRLSSALWLVALGVVISACNSSDTVMEMECGPQGQCPPGFMCNPVNNRCIRTTGMQPDARTPLFDARPATFDAAPGNNATINVHVNAGGSVTGNTASFSCSGGDCPLTVPKNTAVKLTATPNTGFRFSGWSGDGACASATANPLDLTPASDLRCTASFIAVFKVSATAVGATSATITATAAPPNTCSGASCTVDTGSMVTLSAGTVAGFRFSGWSGDPQCAGTAATLVLASVTSRIDCNANYVKRFTVQGSITGATGMTVTAASPDSTATCSGSMCVADQGSQVTLTAPTIAGFRLTGWSGTGCTASGSVVTVNPVSADVSCTAAYVQGISVSGSVAGATGTVDASSPGVTCSSGTCIIDAGGSATLTAPPIAGFRFKGWTGDAPCTGSNTTLSFTNVTTSISCVANYVQRVTVTWAMEGTPVAPLGMVTLTPTDPTATCFANSCTVDVFTPVMVSAPSPVNYKFLGWEGDCAGGTMTTITPSGNESCTATYLRQQTILFAAQPFAGGTVSVEGGGCALTACTVDYGTVLTFSYEANPGWTFSRWNSAQCTATTDNHATATANDDITCDALFVQQVTVTFGELPLGGGTVTASGGGCTASGCLVDPGTDMTFSYTTAAGYRFGSWSGDCVATMNNMAAATADTNIDCTANFIPQYTITVQSVPPGAGDVSLSGSGCSGTTCVVDPNTPVTITDAENTNFRFIQWTGCTLSTSPSTQVVVNSDVTCNARHYGLWAVTYGNKGVDESLAVTTLEDGSISVDGATVGARTFGGHLRLDNMTGDPILDPNAVTSITSDPNDAVFAADAVPLGSSARAVLIADAVPVIHPQLIFVDKGETITRSRDYVLGSSFNLLFPQRLIRTPDDGGFVIGGTGRRIDSSVFQTYLAKVQADGVWSWSQSWFVTGRSSQSATLVAMMDFLGKKIIVASTVTAPTLGPRFWTLLTQVDPGGTIDWTYAYQTSARVNVPTSLTEGLNGEIVLAGDIEEADRDPNNLTGACTAVACDVFVLRVDPSTGAPAGSAVRFGRAGTTDRLARIRTGADRYYAVGETTFNDSRKEDFWFVTLDERGAPIDQWAFGGPATDSATAVDEAPLGGYVITGATASFGTGSNDSWTVRVDDEGKLDAFSEPTAVIAATTYNFGTLTATRVEQALSVTQASMKDTNSTLSIRRVRYNEAHQAP